MSVKIKGMDLPTSCISCPLYMLNKYSYRFCYAAPDIHIADWDAEFKRDDDCPMEEEE